MHLKNGNEDKVVEELYLSVWPQIRGYVRSNGGNLEQAEDVFHDVVIKLIVKLRKGEQEALRQIEPYLFVMAKNHWLNKIKRESRVKLVDQFSDFNDLIAPASIEGTDELLNIMQEALSKIGDTCRDLLTLTYFKDFSLEKATIEMGLSSTDVARTYHYRCKKKLLKEVEHNQTLKELMSLS